MRRAYLILLSVLVLAVGCADERKPEDSEVIQPAPPGHIRASHILISYAGVPRTEAVRTKEEAASLAEDILKRIKAGEDFEVLARRYSDCPTAQQEKSGDLGFFDKGKMVKPFEDAAFGLEVGEVSEVIETKFGYHIIKRTQ